MLRNMENTPYPVKSKTSFSIESILSKKFERKNDSETLRNMNDTCSVNEEEKDLISFNNRLNEDHPNINNISSDSTSEFECEHNKCKKMTNFVIRISEN